MGFTVVDSFMFVPRPVDLYVYLREYFCHITSDHTLGMEGIIIEYLHRRVGSWIEFKRKNSNSIYCLHQLFIYCLFKPKIETYCKGRIAISRQTFFGRDRNHKSS